MNKYSLARSLLSFGHPEIAYGLIYAFANGCFIRPSKTPRFTGNYVLRKNKEKFELIIKI
jgi:hypothetical protein